MYGAAPADKGRIVSATRGGEAEGCVGSPRLNRESIESSVSAAAPAVVDAISRGESPRVNRESALFSASPVPSAFL